MALSPQSLGMATVQSHADDPTSKPFAGRYRLDAEIARGGSARVYQATDLETNRVIALKVRDDFSQALDRRRFLREIRLTGELKHPNILPLLDSGEADGRLYLALPLIAGGTLRDRIRKEKQLPFEDVCAIARDVGAALSFAHAHGVVHRDVKPANILLDGATTFLTDFGVARTAAGGTTDEASTSTGVVVGTIAYMSPEQAAGERDLDARTDVYSFACTLYECITGMPAFTGPTVQSVLTQRMNHPPRDVRVYRQSAPKALSVVLTKALSAAPADRYMTVDHFVEALVAAVQSSPTTARSPAAQARRRRIAIAFLAMGVLATVGVTTAVMRRTRGRAAPAGGEPFVRVAVAPFRVLSGDTIWSMGLMEVLSRNVDGAGAVRSVPPSAGAKSWRGDASDSGARAYGAQLHADVVVYGSLMRSADSVRATAWLTDLGTTRSVLIEVRDDSARMDRVIDSLTVRMLRELGRTRAIGAVRGESFGSSSLPALREFLEGEQEYRLNRAEAAREHYEAAIALDATFALAYRRMRSVLRMTNDENDTASYRYALEAGIRNRNLGTRDSLLVLADSLAASRARRTGVSIVDDLDTHRELVRRFEALERAAREYPSDPEVWYELAEAQHHLGQYFGYTPRTALESFERALAADPGYTPAYFHAIELGVEFRGPDSTARIVEAYLRQRPDDGRIVVVREVLSALAHGRPLDARTLARFPPRDVKDAAYVLRRAHGPPHPSLVLWRRVASSPTADKAMRDDARAWAFHDLVFEGRLREAVAMAEPGTLSSLPQTTLFVADMGALAPALADSLFRAWIHASDWRAVMATLPWWARRRDSARIDTVAARARALLDSGTSTGRERAFAQYLLSAAAMYHALARGDTSTALHLARSLADSLCTWYCVSERLVTAQLLARAGDADGAAAFLDRHPPSAAPFTVAEVQWHLERAGLDARRASAARTAVSRRALADAAAMHLAFVAQAWQDADPSVRALVQAIRSPIAASAAQ